MRVLYGKCFGIGNAVMAVPALKAIRSLPEVSNLDVLIGMGPDDVGAINVMHELQKNLTIDVIHTNVVEGVPDYDLAIMAIPFDGRWRNGEHFRANKVVDLRPRPDPSTQGLVSWSMSEVLYQMENAVAMGYSGRTPSCHFMFRPNNDDQTIYLGIGYKKDRAGFWKAKHWGNDNYATFIETLFGIDPNVKIVTTGDAADFTQSIRPIMESVDDERMTYIPTTNLTQAFEIVGECTMYFGNDTGMMHVAASFDMPTAGLFFLENSHTKSSPWCRQSHIFYDPERKIDPPAMACKALEILDASI